MNPGDSVGQRFYAHTAEDGEGRRLPSESGRWQLLKDHLRQVADLAKRFARPLGLEAEAELAGVLHDLGKYAGRFQARLRDNSIQGVNHWAAGGAHAAELHFHNCAFAVDGHHTGMPARDGDGLKQTVARMRLDTERENFCKCAEPLSELLRRFTADGLSLPDIPARTPGDPFSEALRTRLLFSCLVDADFRGTEDHYHPGAAGLRQVPALQPDRALEVLRRHLAGLRGEGDVNQRRRKLLADCLAAATQPPGVFTLTAPTGSIDAILPLDLCITRVTDTDKEEGEMGRKNLIPYGLYRCHGFISAHLARDTGFSEDDLGVLFKALCGRAALSEQHGPSMFDNDHSASRGTMAPQKLVVFKHQTPLGNAPAHKLFERVTAKRKVGVDVARAFSDYDVIVNTDSLPAGIEVLELL